METDSEIYVFGGRLYKLHHESKSTKTKMNINVYLPKQYFETSAAKVPVLYYLSGLTCTPQNCTEKGGFYSYADKHGIAVVLPDTSPKGLDIAGIRDSWDFGESASFYLNSTKAPFKENFQMYDYITKEIAEVVGAQFKGLDFENKSIFGHSMGGFGSLMIFLKSGEFKSVSCFAPISNPTQCPWGQKAFGGYLESEKEWASYDPIELIKKYDGPQTKILVHQGTADSFYKQKQLQPESLEASSKGTKCDVELHLVDGFDHSYFFIASFMEQHFAHHAKYLK